MVAPIKAAAVPPTSSAADFNSRRKGPGSFFVRKNVAGTGYEAAAAAASGAGNVDGCQDATAGLPLEEFWGTAEEELLLELLVFVA